MNLNAIKTVRTLLPTDSSVTREQIEMAVSMAMMMPVFADISKEQLIRELEEIYSIRSEEFRIITGAERRMPWLRDKHSTIQWNFWERYLDYLESEKNFAPNTISHLNRLTDRILDNLFDPTGNYRIDKRGLVVGQVQSGKTSNYLGLINKAADTGYKLIIVLAGIHSNLRSQTQSRIDEGFLGFDTQHDRAFDQDNVWIGVGRINQQFVAHSLTSSLEKGDFSQKGASAAGMHFNTNEPIIAVVKKNATILKRLKAWLSPKATASEPDGYRYIRNKAVLMIDDEADNASINTSFDQEKVTAINGHIRDILRLFEKSAYVGYTATPFANIFIPIKDDDLFPRDFIINIPAPSNYIGPERVFGFSPLRDDDILEKTLPIVHRIDDFANFVPERHKLDDPKPSVVPESLKRAIKCFITTCAIRRLRGQRQVHNSMLIHVTRFVPWQTRVKELVEQTFDVYRLGLKNRHPDVLEEFRHIFEVDFEGYKSFLSTSSEILDSPLSALDSKIQIHKYADVLPELYEAASRIEVREINGYSIDALHYVDHKEGLSVIAVGGDKLSRGLTLEGLSVSYFLRPSKMYDTLMQMGRWFGYRPGYVDLCRLFTSRELNEWFCHITVASEELREEFEFMADKAGSTPEQYALKVRTHPGVLQISASNKIRSAVEIRVSWTGKLVESYVLCKEKGVVKSNFQHTLKFVGNLPGSFERPSNHYLWRNLPADYVKEFLRGITLADSNKMAEPEKLITFIDKQLKDGELKHWSIAVMSKRDTDKRFDNILPNCISDIGYFKREQDCNNSNDQEYYLRKSHLISPRHEFIDLSVEEYEMAQRMTKEERSRNGDMEEPAYPNGKLVRNTIRKEPVQRPLLLIYFLDPDGAKMKDSSTPLIGFAISFPGSNRPDTAVSYAVHEQLLERFNNGPEDEENDEENED